MIIDTTRYNIYIYSTILYVLHSKCTAPAGTFDVTKFRGVMKFRGDMGVIPAAFPSDDSEAISALSMLLQRLAGEMVR